MGRDTRHISEDEKKKNVLIFVLIGILAVIFLTIVIIMFPFGKKDNNVQLADNGLQQQPVYSNNIEQNTSRKDKTNTSSKRMRNSTEGNIDIIAKDKNKVSIEIKPESLTIDGAVIVITDTNVTPYSWTPIYKLQQKIDGKWEDMELKYPENALFPDIEYDNATGVMEQSLVWSNKYGQLETGEYRIVKEASGIEFYVSFNVQ